MFCFIVVSQCDTRQISHGLSCLQEQLQLTSAQRRQTVRLRNEYLEAMEELMSERAALNVAIQAAAAHTEENAQVAEDHAKVRITCIRSLTLSVCYFDGIPLKQLRRCMCTHVLSVDGIAFAGTIHSYDSHSSRPSRD